MDGREKPKLDIWHFLSAIKPGKLRFCLERNLPFDFHDLKADFDGSTAHVMEFSEAFAKINGSPTGYWKPDKQVEIRAVTHRLCLTVEQGRFERRQTFENQNVVKLSPTPAFAQLQKKIHLH